MARKQLTLIVTLSAHAYARAASIRRELKERANYSGFQFWDCGLKVKSVKPADVVAHEEVVALRERVARYEMVLERCEEQFRFYEHQHVAKRTEDGNRKAGINAAMAMVCENVREDGYKVDETLQWLAEQKEQAVALQQ